MGKGKALGNRETTVQIILFYFRTVFDIVLLLVEAENSTAYKSHSLHPLLCWWAPRLAPCLGFCVQRHNNPSGEGTTAVCCLLFLGLALGSGVAAPHSQSIFSSLRARRAAPAHILTGSE